MSTDALGGSIGSAFVDIRLSMDKIGKDLSGLESELKKKLGGTIPPLENTKNAFTGLLGVRPVRGQRHRHRRCSRGVRSGSEHRC
jgi:hypothetical protein